MMDLHTTTEILLDTARAYGEGTTHAGNVIAAGYRLGAIKLHEHGSHQHAQDLERAADQAESTARLERGIPRDPLLLREGVDPSRPAPSVADRIAEGRRLVAAFNGGSLSALTIAGLVPTLLDQLEGLLAEGFSRREDLVKLTAATITDDQIRALRTRLGSETYAGSSNDAADCDVALAAPIGSLRRVQARARCAEIIGTRSFT